MQQRAVGVPPADCQRAFVKNLSYETTEDQLGNMFRFCGEIENVRISRHYSTNASKGFGYIDFTTHVALKKALEQDGKPLLGRKLTVDFDTGNMKQGFRLNTSGEGNDKYNRQ